MKKISVFTVVLGALTLFGGCSGGEDEVQTEFVQKGGTIYGGNHLKVQDNNVFVCGDKFYILDASNVSSPQLGGELEYNNVEFQDVALKSDVAFPVAVGGNAGFLLAVDVSDISNPVVLGFKSYTPMWSIAVNGNYAFIAVGDSGLLVYDISNVYSMSQVASLKLGGDVRELWLAGDSLYMASPYSSQVWIVDVSDPANPVLGSTIMMSDSAKGQDVHALNNTALVSCPEGFVMLDATTGQLSITKPSSGEAYAGWMESQRAFIAIKSTGVNKTHIGLFDISDPSAPALVVSSDEANGNPTDIIYKNGFCYLLTEEGMFIYQLVE